MYAIMLALAVMAQPRTVTIIHDAGRESKLLVGDLTRDWQAVVQNDTTKRLSDIQCGFAHRVKFIDVTSLDSKVLKYSGLRKYPAIMYGNDTRLIYLPDEAFMMHSFGLLSLEACINRIEFEYNYYQDKCIRSENIASEKYIAWLNANHPTELAEFIASLMYSEDYIHISTYLALKKRFASIKGLPSYPPIYPERPRIWFPWEMEFRFEHSQERIYPGQVREVCK